MENKWAPCPAVFHVGPRKRIIVAGVSKCFQCGALSTGSLEKIGQQLKMELIVCLLKRPMVASQEYPENNHAEDIGRQLLDLLCLLLLGRARIR